MTTEVTGQPEKTLTLEHRDAPGYVAASATGVSISGPSGDGLLHMTFFRDMMRPEAEDFTMQPATQDPNNVAFTLTQKPSRTPLMYRVDVATISVQASHMEAMVNGLRTALERTKG